MRGPVRAGSCDFMASEGQSLFMRGPVCAGSCDSMASEGLS